MISEVDPVKGASNPNLSCGQSAKPATLTVPANPGSDVSITWINGNGGPVSYIWSDVSEIIHTDDAAYAVAPRHRSVDELHGTLRQ